MPGALESYFLPLWAADAHQRQQATIIFRHAATGAAWETLPPASGLLEQPAPRD